MTKKHYLTKLLLSFFMLFTAYDTPISASSIIGKIQITGSADLILVNMESLTITNVISTTKSISFKFNKVKKGSYGLIIRDYYDPTNILDYAEAIITPITIQNNETIELTNIELFYPTTTSQLSDIADAYRGISPETIEIIDQINAPITDNNPIDDEPHYHRYGTTPYDWY